ncbi:MAG: hypothetical protein LC650_00340 [Actinobacteria bacterium]|nr:hypothetical protein [Actinomycetota bacterium]
MNSEMEKAKDSFRQGQVTDLTNLTEEERAEFYVWARRTIAATHRRSGIITT